jgi:uncharacterized membrane protein
VLHVLPIHPLLVHAPAALIPLATLTDVVARWRPQSELRLTADWIWLFAAIGTPLASATGWLWWWQMDRPEQTLMDLHRWLGTVLALMVPAYVGFRLWRRHRLTLQKTSTGRLMAGISISLLVVIQGHAGATLTFATAETSAAPTTRPTTATSTGSGDDGWRDFLDLKERR